jgi:TnsA endonuclease N terminal
MHLHPLPGRIIGTRTRGLSGKVTLRDRTVVSFESSLERDCIIGLDFACGGRLICAQPFTLEYADNDHAKRHYYTPDIKVEFAKHERRQTQIIEVKPLSELESSLAKDAVKHEAMRTFCEKRGWAFRIQTELDIRRGAYIENATFLRGYLNSSFPEISALTMMAALSGKAMSPNELIKQTFPVEAVHPNAIWVLWCLVARGAILTDLTKPLNMVTTTLELEKRFAGLVELPEDFDSYRPVLFKSAL